MAGGNRRTFPRLSEDVCAAAAFCWALGMECIFWLRLQCVPMNVLYSVLLAIIEGSQQASIGWSMLAQPAKLSQLYVGALLSQVFLVPFLPQAFRLWLILRSKTFPDIAESLGESLQVLHKPTKPLCPGDNLR